MAIFTITAGPYISVPKLPAVTVALGVDLVLESLVYIKSTGIPRTLEAIYIQVSHQAINFHQRNVLR